MNGSYSNLLLCIAFTLYMGGFESASAQVPEPPVITTAPSQLTNLNPVAVGGTADMAATDVEVSGPAGVQTFSVASGVWSGNVNLVDDSRNQLYFRTITASDISAPTALAITHDTLEPGLTIQSPAEGDVVTAESIDVFGALGDVLSGLAGMTVVVEGAGGGMVNATVGSADGMGGTFLAEGVPLNIDATTMITVTATDSLGNLATGQVMVTHQTPVSHRMELVSGQFQVGEINSVLPDPLVVRVVRSDTSPAGRHVVDPDPSFNGFRPPNLNDANGFRGKIVDFRVVGGDGRLTTDGMGDGQTRLQVRADGEGLAQVYLRLGSNTGEGANRVVATSRDIQGTAEFFSTAENITTGATQIAIASGDDQTAEVSTEAPLPLRVWVSDGLNGISGVNVTFNVDQGGGLIGGMSSVMVATDAMGFAEVTYELGMNPGNNRVTADHATNEGTLVSFDIIGVERGMGNTSLSGVVLDQAGNPLGDANSSLGVRCNLTVNGVAEMEVFTDENGLFTFPDIADGYGQLSIEGGNLGPYSDATFEIFIIPDVDNSLPGPIFLTEFTTAGVTFNSAMQTRISLAIFDFDGMNIVVDPNGVFNPDGSQLHDGTLFLEQVHHDNLQASLPNGAAPILATTIEPAGLTFDPPAEIQYPNCSGLAPGTPTSFFAFDATVGQFTTVAAARVSDDGSVILPIQGDAPVGLTLSGQASYSPPLAPTGSIETPPGGVTFVDPTSFVLTSLARKQRPDTPETGSRRDTVQATASTSFVSSRTVEGLERHRERHREGLPPRLVIPTTFGSFLYSVDGYRIEEVGLRCSWDRFHDTFSGLKAPQVYGPGLYDVAIERTNPMEVSAYRDGFWMRVSPFPRDFFYPLEEGSSRYHSDNYHGELLDPPDHAPRLEFVEGATWEFRDPDGMRDLARGKIHRIHDALGNAVAFEYDDQGRLVVIRDGMNRHIRIHYAVDDRVLAVTDSSGRTWVFD